MISGCSGLHCCEDYQWNGIATESCGHIELLAARPHAESWRRGLRCAGVQPFVVLSFLACAKQLKMLCSCYCSLVVEAVYYWSLDFKVVADCLKSFQCLSDFGSGLRCMKNSCIEWASVLLFWGFYLENLGLLYQMGFDSISLSSQV